MSFVMTALSIDNYIFLSPLFHCSDECYPFLLISISLSVFSDRKHFLLIFVLNLSHFIFKCLLY